MTALDSEGRVCILNGAPVPWAEAAVSVMDRGFLYGDSAFEVLRTYGRQPFLLDEHLARLDAGCRALGIGAAPSGRIRTDVQRALARLAGDAYLRIVVTRGQSARGIHHCSGPPTRVVLAHPLPPSLEVHREAGVSVVTVPFGAALDGTPAAGVKASNYLPNILALQQAEKRGAYEAILVGPGGEVREGATSNLFVVLGGTLITPPCELGILPGITRRLVLESAGAVMPVQTRLLFPFELYAADEAWITSSVRELLPVVQVDGQPLGDGRVGPWFARVFAAFRFRVHSLTVDGGAGAG